MCYDEFLEVVDVNNSWELEEVIKESEGINQRPVGKDHQRAYIKHLVDCFYPFLSSRIKFLPDWGLWWQKERKKEDYDHLVIIYCHGQHIQSGV